MDLGEFASRPDSPRWEIPQNIRPTRREQVEVSPASLSLQFGEPCERRAQILSRTTFKVEQLCFDSTVEARSIQDLLAIWIVTGSNSGKLQPNLLAWLNSSEALVSAINNQRQDVIQYLLDYGLIPDSRAIAAALTHVLDSKDMSLLELLIRGGWETNRVFNQVQPSIMRSLVERCLSLGGDPNGSSPSKTTVLHRAACTGSVGSLEVLIGAGGQIKSPCPSDDVVAHAVDCHSESKDRIPAIQYLLDHGADIDAYLCQSYDPHFPSDFAIFMGKQTALHIAIGKGDQLLVEWLMNRGADSSKLMWNYGTAYSTIKGHAGDSNWQQHIKWLDPVEYARFSGFEGIAVLLQNFTTEYTDLVSTEIIRPLIQVLVANITSLCSVVRGRRFCRMHLSRILPC